MEGTPCPPLVSLHFKPPSPHVTPAFVHKDERRKGLKTRCELRTSNAPFTEPPINPGDRDIRPTVSFNTNYIIVRPRRKRKRELVHLAHAPWPEGEASEQAAGQCGSVCFEKRVAQAPSPGKSLHSRGRLCHAKPGATKLTHYRPPGSGTY
jgi:hypothetical protein